MLIAAGGTGGHVYPALAAAEAMVRQYPEVQLCFVGTVGGFERPLVERADLTFASYDEVQAGPIHGVNPLRMLVSMGKLFSGTFQALRLLSRHRPEVILSTMGKLTSCAGSPAAECACAHFFARCRTRLDDQDAADFCEKGRTDCARIGTVFS